jgi:hypothetical protein
MDQRTANKSARLYCAALGEFVLARREDVLRSWIAAVDRNAQITSSDSLTYSQLLDHLPELCTELAALLKNPGTREIKRKAKHDAKAHGWKRWRQGYRLDELIREICVIRRDFVETWLPTFSRSRRQVNYEMQEQARRVVERFFDNVVIDATVQFVSEHSDAVDESIGVSGRDSSRSAPTPELLREIADRVREPLGPLLFAIEALRQERNLSQRSLDTLGTLEQALYNTKLGLNMLLSGYPWPTDQKKK